MDEKKNKANKKDRVKRTVLNIITLILVGVIIYSGYNIWKINNNYVEEKKVHNQVLDFKPSVTHSQGNNPGTTQSPDNPSGPGNTNVVVNPSIEEAGKVNKDTVGWIEIPNTKVDYPFVQSDDNSYYLERDFYGKKATAGTLFMDFRCKNDFSSFNSIIYGHHMKNGSMFGTIKNFADRDFFNNNTEGKIYLIDKTYTLEIFAYLIINTSDMMIYNTINADEEKVAEYNEHIKEKATQYREVGLSADDRIVTLSTCANYDDDLRLILLARLK